MPYALLAPGLVWLLVFFVAPMLTLGSQSLQEGSVEEGYTFTGNVAIYADAIARYWPHLLRSVGYAAIRDGARPACWATRWPTSWR